MSNLSDRSLVLARFKTRKGFVPNALEPGTEIRIIARSQANFPPVIAKELTKRLEMPRVAVHFEAKQVRESHVTRDDERQERFDIAHLEYLIGR